MYLSLVLSYASDHQCIFFFYGYGAHRELHVLTHSFPTRRSSDLYPPPHLATCSAVHSKKPASSKSRLIIIIATNVAVAFQTICQTTGMSLKLTTPKASASAAPIKALQPMFKPRGCQMTRTMVTIKINNAASRSEEHTSELQSLMRISYAVFCLKKKKQN